MRRAEAQQAAIDELTTELLAMGRQVEAMIGRSMRALGDGDPPLAWQTIVLDRRVNQAEIDIDARCMTLIVAGGLDEVAARRIMAAAKMVVDLERIGDMAVNICELTIGTEETGVPGDMDALRAMADVVVEMLRGALTAYREGDAEAAQRVIHRDDEVDLACEAYTDKVLGRLSQGRGQPAVSVPAQNVARMLERMADHATNLAEQVIFVVHGRDVRHPGKRVR